MTQVTDRIEKSIHLKAPRDKVWRAIIEPEQFGSWFGVRIEEGPFEVGTLTVGQITPVDVQGWLANLHASHRSASTVAKAYRVLKGALDGAVDAGLIKQSPCTLKGAGTEQHDEMRIAAPELGGFVFRGKSLQFGRIAGACEFASAKWKRELFMKPASA